MAHYASQLELTGDEFIFFAEVISAIDVAYRNAAAEKDRQKPKPAGGK